jgi:heterogeneous nuclear ribonucleoprotein R
MATTEEPVNTEPKAQEQEASAEPAAAETAADATNTGAEAMQADEAPADASADDAAQPTAPMDAAAADVPAADDATAADAPQEATAMDAAATVDGQAPADDAAQSAVDKAEDAQPAAAETTTTADQTDTTAANGTAEAMATDDEPSFMKEPPHGAEVFVGGLPRQATEDQLKEFARPVGEVHSVSLARDPGSQGQNKGYGFIKFTTKESADKAKVDLHQKEMTEYPGVKLRIQNSQSKNKLFLGNIPKDMSQDALEQALNQAVKGVTHVERVMSKDNPDLNRGFCFIELYNHAAAQAAKATLSAPDFKLGDRALTVSYAEPKQSEQFQDTVKSIYVGNLPAGVTEESLKAFFTKLDVGTVEKAVIPPKKADRDHADYGFVHFVQRGVAQKLVQECEAKQRVIKFPEDSDNMLQIKMARPQVNNAVTPGGQYGAGRGGAQAGYGSGGYGSSYGGGGGGYGGGYGGAGRGRGGGRGYGAAAGGGYGQAGGYDNYSAGAGYGYGAQQFAGGGYGYDASGGYSYGNYGAGMQMVPMMLPSGQMGYVMQPAAGAGAGGYGADRRGRGGRRPAPY